MAFAKKRKKLFAFRGGRATTRGCEERACRRGVAAVMGVAGAFRLKDEMGFPRRGGAAVAVSTFCEEKAKLFSLRGRGNFAGLFMRREERGSPWCFLEARESADGRFLG